MNYKYKVKWFRQNRTDESGEISGPDGFGMALKLAEHWIATRGGKANVLRADNRGVNAGKFFLHHIVKG